MAKKDLFIKGIALGFDNESWSKNRNLFPSKLLSILETWRYDIYDSQDCLILEVTEEQERMFGKIKTAIWGLESDMENLTINYHLMTSLLSKDIGRGLKSLYISLLVENYIINLRSIYDFCSIFPGIIMPTNDFLEYQKRKYSDSLNTFIKYCNCDASENLLYSLKKLMINTQEELNTIKSIRDLIIHKGKEAIVDLKNDEVLFRIPQKPPYGKVNTLPDILNLGNVDYPLLPYLKTLTVKLLIFMDNLADVLLQELKKDEKYQLQLVALIGICVEDFYDFIYPINSDV